MLYPGKSQGWFVPQVRRFQGLGKTYGACGEKQHDSPMTRLGFQGKILNADLFLILIALIKSHLIVAAALPAQFGASVATSAVQTAGFLIRRTTTGPEEDRHTPHLAAAIVPVDNQAGRTDQHGQCQDHIERSGQIVPHELYKIGKIIPLIVCSFVGDYRCAADQVCSTPAIVRTGNDFGRLTAFRRVHRPLRCSAHRNGRNGSNPAGRYRRLPALCRRYYRNPTGRPLSGSRRRWFWPDRTIP